MNKEISLIQSVKNSHDNQVFHTLYNYFIAKSYISGKKKKKKKN